jgi:hypothetical protein
MSNSTRRGLLADLGVGVGALAVTAGCTVPRSGGGPGAVCAASLSGTDGSVFALTPQVASTGAGGDDGTEPGLVVLVVPIRQATIRAEDVDLIRIVDGEDVRYRIPVHPGDEPVGETSRYDAADVVEYAQSLGHVPQTGRYRLVALDAAGERIDEIRIDFRCYRPVDEGPDAGE